jgi:hypothetical protein
LVRERHSNVVRTEIEDKLAHIFLGITTDDYSKAAKLFGCEMIEGDIKSRTEVDPLRI